MPASASVYDICTRNPTPTRSSTNTNVTTQRPRRNPSRNTRVHRRAVDPHSPWDDLERVLQYVLSRSFLGGGLARSARPYIRRGCQGWRRTSDPLCRPCGVRSRRNPSREKFVQVLGCQVVGRKRGKVDSLIRRLGLLNEGLRKGAYFEVRMGG